ncbi:MAG: cyclic-di-AMP receptor [Chloroflexi bacterium]|nr:cyclic-di-AMP receptor [Chloroflexota bacterium]
MKLIIAVVHNEDADDVVDTLLDARYRATRLASTGGFLRRGNTTIMLGVQDDQVDDVLGLIKAKAHSRPATNPQGDAVRSGAATVFVLELEQYERL